MPIQRGLYNIIGCGLLIGSGKKKKIKIREDCQIILKQNWIKCYIKIIYFYFNCIDAWIWLVYRKQQTTI